MFDGCYGLTEFYVETNNPSFASEDGVLFSKDKCTLIFYPRRKTGPYVVPDGVTNIGEYACADCGGLTSITLANSITTLKEGAFSGSANLTTISFGNGAMKIEDEAFTGCYGLKNVLVPSLQVWLGIDFAGYIANPLCYAENFYVGGERISNLIIPYGVTDIGAQAFYGYSGLTSLIIPNTVTNIGRAAFFECGGLTSLSLGRGVRRLESSAFDYCDGLTSVTIPGNVEDVAGFHACANLSSVSIANGVKNIGPVTFNSCNSLPELTIPFSVTNVGDYAFSGCLVLEKLYVPISWQGTEMLAKSSVPTNCTTIYYTTNIEWAYSVTANTAMLTAVRTVERDVVIRDLVIPPEIDGYAVTSIAANTFGEQVHLTSVMIPDGVTNIGYATFSGCSGLRNLYVPESWKGTMMLSDAGVPKECDVVYGKPEMPDGGATSTTMVPVPLSWMEENVEELLVEYGGNYEAAAHAAAANGRPVWECYLTGVDPAVSNQLFEASLEYDENGKLTVKWTPDLNEDGTKSERLYWVKGKKDVMDEEWSDVTDVEDLEEEGWSFFRVGVKMP